MRHMKKLIPPIAIFIISSLYYFDVLAQDGWIACEHYDNGTIIVVPGPNCPYGWRRP